MSLIHPGGRWRSLEVDSRGFMASGQRPFLVLLNAGDDGEKIEACLNSSSFSISFSNFVGRDGVFL
jgi:proteasome lid subunit RPN8/RPN11